MAEVIIVMRDKPDGKVEMAVTPRTDEIIAKLKSGHGLSAAEDMALAALNRIREVSESNRPKPSNIWVP